MYSLFIIFITYLFEDYYQRFWFKSSVMQTE